MNIFHKHSAITNSYEGIETLLLFLREMASVMTSEEDLLFIRELHQMVNHPSSESLNISTLEQDNHSNMSLSSPHTRDTKSEPSFLINRTEITSGFVETSARTEAPLSKTVIQAIFSYLKAKNTGDHLPIMGISSLKNRVNIECIIGHMRIPFTAYAPLNPEGEKWSKTLHLHPRIFDLDRELSENLDPRVYHLSNDSFKKHKDFFVSKRILTEDATESEVALLYKRKFKQNIINISNGFLSGLVFRTPSLVSNERMAGFYALYLLTFFILDDSAENFTSVQDARAFSKNALDILSGKRDAPSSETERHPGYYLAAQFRQEAIDLIGNGSSEILDVKLTNWYHLMAEQFYSVIEEVKSKGKIDSILPDYSKYEEQRIQTIGTRPCLEMIDVLLDIKWTHETRHKLDLIERQVAKAVFEFNNVVSLYKELKEAFVDTDELSPEDFCTKFSGHTVISTLDSETLTKLPLNGVLIRSYYSRTTLLAAMSEGIRIYDSTTRELEISLNELCEEISDHKELEAIQARFSLAIGSTRWSMKTGRYTLNKEAVKDTWWKTLNADLFPK